MPTAPLSPVGDGDGSGDPSTGGDAGPAGQTGDAGPSAGDGIPDEPLDGGDIVREDAGTVPDGGGQDGSAGDGDGTGGDGTSGDGSDGDVGTGDECRGTDGPVKAPGDCSSSTGTTTGVVRDVLTGSPIAGVTIRSAVCDGMVTTSDDDGSFTITISTRDGDYLRLEKAGLAKGLSVYLTEAREGLDVYMVGANLVTSHRRACTTEPLSVLKVLGSGRAGVSATGLASEAITYLNASFAATAGGSTTAAGLALATGSPDVPGVMQFLDLPGNCTATSYLPIERDRVAVDVVTCD